MRIGIDASRANTTQRTGTEWYSYYVIEGFKKLDPKSEYVLYTKETLLNDIKELPEAWESRVLTWKPGKLWTQFRLSWEMLLHAPDLLFVPAHVIPIFHPKKIVTTCHDVGFERFPELYSEKELKYHRFAMRMAVKHAQKIITVSEFTKKEMMDVYGIPDEQIVPIHNGYDSSLYCVIEDQQKINSVKEKYNLEKPFFFTIGRLEKKKNTKMLIDAFTEFYKQNQNYELVLAGTPGEHGYEDIQKAIKDSSAKDAIKELGYVPEEDVPLLHNAAFGFVFPSFYEGFGIPAIEAMACGTPTILSRSGSLPEIGGDASLYFDAHDISQLVEAFVRFDQGQNLREDLQKKGFDRIQQFSWKKCAQETLNVVKSVANS